MSILFALVLSHTLQLVRRYLYNRGRRAPKKSTFNLGRQWTFHDVVVDAHREEIHNMALSLSDSKAGSTEYLKCYRKALKTFEDGISDETKANYRAQAKKWTEEKPTPRQQLRYAHSHHSSSRRQEGTKHQQRIMDKHGMSTLRDFARYAYCQFGMRIAVFAAYRDIEGDPAVTL
jgi:hypothetical protein